MRKIAVAISTVGLIIASTLPAHASLKDDELEWIFHGKEQITSRSWDQKKSTIFITGEMHPCKWVSSIDKKKRDIYYTFQLEKKHRLSWKHYANPRIVNACTDPATLIWTDAPKGKYRFELMVVATDHKVIAEGSVFFNGNKPKKG